MNFSKEVLSKAIRSASGELAWNRADVIIAIDELIEYSNAILGGDVWAVVDSNNKFSRLEQIENGKIAVGVIKSLDGTDNIYNWYCDKLENESWDNFVWRSKIEAIDAISKLNSEENVAKELQNSIYYNLVFVDKNQYEDLLLSRKKHRL